MAIVHRLLGAPYQDNALFVRVESGQAVYRLLFDCGEKTVSELPPGEIVKIDHLFFSHFHLDHVAGLDHFIRLNYNREGKPVNIWGPEKTATKIFNRLNSFTWNLLEKSQTDWFVHEVNSNTVSHFLISARDQFCTIKHLASEPWSEVIVRTNDFYVSTILLDHKIPVLGFKVVEQEKEKVNGQKLRTLNLEAGPWIKQLLDHSENHEKEIKLNGKQYKLGQLRKILLYHVPGSSLAYLTDFLNTETTAQRIINWLKGVQILYCESQYLNADHALASKNFHLTVEEAAGIAARSRVQQLFIFHFSQRYKHLSPLSFLQQARKIFSNSFLPEGWLNGF